MPVCYYHMNWLQGLFVMFRMSIACTAVHPAQFMSLVKCLNKLYWMLTDVMDHRNDKQQTDLSQKSNMK